LGSHVHFDPAPEPLLAPPLDRTWTVMWSSEDPSYGGGGTAPVESEDNWRLPAESAILLAPGRRTPWIRQCAGCSSIQRTSLRRACFSSANGWWPTGWGATPPAPFPVMSRAAITDC